ncbi:MAG: hypothetical protein PHE55_15620, partial [Methylococcaceae bacterium]|nr:hypothetical protein [Methylococcaceae bacterium]
MSFLTRMSKGLILAVPLLFSQASAEPLYGQKLQAAQPNAEQMADSQKLTREHREVKHREKMRVPSFHKQVEDPIPQAGSFCQNCHGPLPHRKKLRTRSFMNMHTRFISCESCHFRPKDVDLAYGWLDDSGHGPQDRQALFRTGRKLDNAVPRNSSFRIAPLFKGEPAGLAKDDPVAKPYLETWKHGDEQEKITVRATIHASLEKEGPHCDRCHAEKEGMLDFAALGASADQEQAIRRHVIPR